MGLKRYDSSENSIILMIDIQTDSIEHLPIKKPSRHEYIDYRLQKWEFFHDFQWHICINEVHLFVDIHQIMAKMNASSLSRFVARYIFCLGRQNSCITVCQSLHKV